MIEVRVHTGVGVGVGMLAPCNATSGCKQKPSNDRQVTVQQCYDGVPNQIGGPNP